MGGDDAWGGVVGGGRTFISSYHGRLAHSSMAEREGRKEDGGGSSSGEGAGEVVVGMPQPSVCRSLFLYITQSRVI